MKKIFALVDCNSFYVSCERAFKPELKKIPIVVLSNNDGCAISLSKEAKKLGFKIGNPYFKIKQFEKSHGVRFFSSNYELYADMSKRVMESLKQFSSRIEVYSIDEAFLDLSDMQISSYKDYGQQISKIIYQNTGIPVSVGIAYTKTLAKVANHIVKKDDSYSGSLNLIGMDEKSINNLLSNHDISEVWGVGRKIALKLRKLEINTTYDLKYMNDLVAKKLLTVIGHRMVLELRGISCINLEEIIQDKKSIACTRSFGQYIKTLSELEEAVATYVDRASIKLREQNSTACLMEVFIRTNHFNKFHKQYANYLMLGIAHPSSYTPYLTKIALQGLRQIYKSGYLYKKAGVVLMGLRPGDNIQYDLFGEVTKASKEKEERLMKAFDNINKRFGLKTVIVASQGTKKVWKMQREYLSPSYTTRLDQVLNVKI